MYDVGAFAVGLELPPISGGDPLEQQAAAMGWLKSHVKSLMSSKVGLRVAEHLIYFELGRVCNHLLAGFEDSGTATKIALTELDIDYQSFL